MAFVRYYVGDVVKMKKSAKITKISYYTLHFMRKY